MLEVDIEKIISIAEAKERFDELVTLVQTSDDLYVLTKNGKPAAILVGVHHLETLTGLSHKELVPEEETEELEMPELPEKLANTTQLGESQGTSDKVDEVAAPLADKAADLITPGVSTSASDNFDVPLPPISPTLPIAPTAAPAAPVDASDADFADIFAAPAEPLAAPTAPASPITPTNAPATPTPVVSETPAPAAPVATILPPATSTDPTATVFQDDLKEDEIPAVNTSSTSTSTAAVPAAAAATTPPVPPAPPANAL